MIEIEIYAPGLRQDSTLKEFCSQMDMLPQARYKVDTNHDLVYFEIDDPDTVTLDQLLECFSSIGLPARIVGHMPEGLRANE